MDLKFGEKKPLEGLLMLMHKYNIKTRSWKVKVLLELVNASIKLLVKYYLYLEKIGI